MLYVLMAWNDSVAWFCIYDPCPAVLKISDPKLWGERAEGLISLTSLYLMLEIHLQIERDE